MIPTDYRSITIDRSALAKIQMNITVYVTIMKSEASRSLRGNALPLSSEQKNVRNAGNLRKPLAFIFTVK
jgi:hypothetical protein